MTSARRGRIVIARSHRSLVSGEDLCLRSEEVRQCAVFVSWFTPCCWAASPPPASGGPFLHKFTRRRGRAPYRGAPASASWECAFECGTVQVPLDYDGSDSSAAISIALVRLPATNAAARIGSLFFNPGGPGGSGVDFVLGFAPFITPSRCARASTSSASIHAASRAAPRSACFGNATQWAPLFTPFAFPRDAGRGGALGSAADRVSIGACDQRAARIIDHMATADVARDLDALREAVGDPLLTFVGYRTAPTSASPTPTCSPTTSVRSSSTVCSIPSHGRPAHRARAPRLPFSTRLRSDAGAQATLQEFFRLCDAGGPALRVRGQRRGPRTQRWRPGSDRAHPVWIPSTGATFPFGYSDLISISLSAMYDSFSWPSFAGLLAFLNSPASTGRSAPARRRSRGQGLVAKRGVPRYRIETGRRHQRLLLRQRQPVLDGGLVAGGRRVGPQFGYFGRIWTWISSPCVAWPGADADRYMGPFVTLTANPVLVVGNLFDPATRYEGAVTVSSLLPNSRLLTLHAWGHTSLLLSQCATQAVAGYLITGQTPQPGSICPQDVVPFTVPSMSAGTASRIEMRRKVRGQLVPGYALRAQR